MGVQNWVEWYSTLVWRLLVIRDMETMCTLIEKEATCNAGSKVEHIETQA